MGGTWPHSEAAGGQVELESLSKLIFECVITKIFSKIHLDNNTTEEHYIIRIFTMIVSEQLNAQRPVVQALSSPKRETYVRVTYLIRAPRACVSSKKSLIIFRAY